MTVQTWTNPAFADRRKSGQGNSVLVPRLDSLSRGFLALGIASLL
jgi:hypothetical protein